MQDLVLATWAICIYNVRQEKHFDFEFVNKKSYGCFLVHHVPIPYDHKCSVDVKCLTQGCICVAGSQWLQIKKPNWRTSLRNKTDIIKLIVFFHSLKWSPGFAYNVQIENGYATK